MQRRNVIKSLAMGMGTAIVLPSWAINWKQKSFQKTTFLKAEESNILAEIVETIIPQTDTPGAKALGVHKLMERIVKDCFATTAQEQFAKGIAATNDLAQKNHSKTFADCTTEQRLELLKQMSKSDDTSQKQFYNMVRQQTIRCYTNSEYYMKNVRKYEFAPGHYYGCVEIKK